MAAELKVTQVRSTNGTSPRQRATLRSLKLGRIGKSAAFADTPQLRGMLDKVGHLVSVDEGAGSKAKAKTKQDGGE